MNEEQRIDPHVSAQGAGEPKTEALPTTEISCEQMPEAPAEEALPTTEASCEQMPEAPAEEALPTTDASCEQTPEVPTPEAAQPLLFDFGATTVSAQSAQGSKKTFVLLFVLTGIVCAVLVFLAFWLGDAGIRITNHTESERIVYVREYTAESGLLTPQEVVDIGQRSTVSILVKTPTSSGIGSGFVYDAQGHIITNYHVIENKLLVEQTTLQVAFLDGTAVDATLVGYNADADLAVLKVAPGAYLTPVAIGSSADLLVGDGVVAIGTPAKLDYAGTATFGSVSATDRLVNMTDLGGTITRRMRLIQTDASVNPGNSGGPLFDHFGKVVGVVVMKVSQYGGTTFDGIGFAIPIDGAKTIVDQIIATGTFSGENPIAQGRSILGFTGHGGVKGKWYSDEADPETGSMVASDEALPGYHYMPESGIYVIEINGGNAPGKVFAGDIVLRADGMLLADVNDLIGVANRKSIGESVNLTILRDGQVIEVSVILSQASE